MDTNIDVHQKELFYIRKNGVENITYKYGIYLMGLVNS